jgi:hypothetical protein
MWFVPRIIRQKKNVCCSKAQGSVAIYYMEASPRIAPGMGLWLFTGNWYKFAFILQYWCQRYFSIFVADSELKLLEHEKHETLSRMPA